jgi:glycoside/pentoside/hexuronide:cation symporter, GPH family
MSKSTSKMMMPWRERISYGLGETASNLSYAAVTTFLLFFYTDIAGIGAVIAGVIMLVARVVDAVFDPFMGIIIDKTHTKWGRCRPFFLWMAIPYGVMLILLFTVPPFGPEGKVAFGIITYLIFGMVYSSINLPLSAMLPSTSDDPQERTTINSIIMIFARFGGLIATLTLVPMTLALGGGDKSKGIFWTAVVYAVIAVILFLVTFFNTKEHVEIQKTQEKIVVRDSLKATFRNKYWVIIAVISLVFFVTTTLIQQSAIYYLANIIGNMGMMSLFGLSIYLSQIAAMFFAPAFAKKIGKRNNALVGILLATIGIVVRFAAGVNIPLFIVGNVVLGFGIGCVGSVLLAMLADCVDYSELKFKVRAQGMMYAADSFAMKLGLGVAGMIGGAILAFGQYDPAAKVQSASALSAINFQFTWAPLIGLILTGALFFIYRLDKKISSVREELKASREKLQN